MSKTVNEPVVYTLSTPVSLIMKDPSTGAETEEPVLTVKVRPPLAGDLRVIDSAKGPAEQTLNLIARLIGHPVGLVDRMTIADFTALAEILGGFLPDGLPTAAISSASLQ
jgi:hypothetical protein